MDRRLPIEEYAYEISNLLSTTQTLLLCAHTGSGKSTKVPLIVNEYFNKNKKQILITQPRRVAAVQLSRRVASQMPDQRQASFSVRFASNANKHTVFHFVTEEVLLKKLVTDPRLLETAVVVVDEVHEASAALSALVPLLLEVQKNRTDLRLLFMTADEETFSDFTLRLPFAKALHVRSKPPDIAFQYWSDNETTFDPFSGFVERTVSTVLHILERDVSARILVFLPGKHEIAAARKRLAGTVFIVSFFSGCDSDETAAVLSGTSAGSFVVLATNVAETSLTIPGLRYVVDSLLVKERSEGAVTRNRLCLVSLAAAQQRAGRCGRNGPGCCFRLVPLAFMQRLANKKSKEVSVSLLLRLATLGVRKFATFPFFHKPPSSELGEKLVWLRKNKLLDEGDKLTKKGRLVSELPVDPKLALFLLVFVRSGNSVYLLSALLLVVLLEHVRPGEVDALFESNKYYFAFRNSHKFKSDFLFVYNAFLSSNNNTFLAKRVLASYSDLVKKLSKVDSQLLLFTKLRKQFAKKDIFCWVVEKPFVALLRSSLANLYASNFLVKQTDAPGYKSAKGVANITISKNSVLANRIPSSLFSRELVVTKDGKLVAETNWETA